MTKTKKRSGNIEAPTGPDDKTELYSETLRVELTAAEIADRADRAAQLISDRDAKEEEHKAAAKHSKSVIESIDAEIRRLSNEVRTRATYRSVECERRFLYRAGTLEEIRTDTGETINKRNMTDAERQLELPFTGDGDEGVE